MRKIIKNKVLDTDTAKMLGTYMVDEQKDIVETLYRTKSGINFIYSVFPLPNQGNLTTGENISIISRPDAEAWAKKYLSEFEYNRYFGDGEGFTSISVKLPDYIVNKMKRIKDITGETYAEIIENAINEMQK